MWEITGVEECGDKRNSGSNIMFAAFREVVRANL